MYRTRTVEKMQHEWSKERSFYRDQIAELTNRIMYLTDRPWVPPPHHNVPNSPRTPQIEAYEDFGPEFTGVNSG